MRTQCEISAIDDKIERALFERRAQGTEYLSILNAISDQLAYLRAERAKLVAQLSGDDHEAS